MQDGAVVMGRRWGCGLGMRTLRLLGEGTKERMCGGEDDDEGKG